jgi:hypothetical protein
MNFIKTYIVSNQEEILSSFVSSKYVENVEKENDLHLRSYFKKTEVPFSLLFLRRTMRLMRSQFCLCVYPSARVCASKVTFQPIIRFFYQIE